jgi:hypothetical protein
MSTLTSRRRPAAAAARAAAPRAPEHPAAAIALWLALVVLAIVRLIATRPGSMAAWGYSLLRFAPPVLAWSAWIVAAACLVPPLARRAMTALERRAPSSGLLMGLLAAALGLLTWMWPDRLHFVGDFLLREGTAARALSPSGLFPQALPLDVFLHYDLPRVAADAWGIPTATSARVLGASCAAAVGALAIGLARALGASGARATALAVVAACGGFLGVMTGYGKAIAEMTVLTMATGVFALRALEAPRWLAALGLTVAVGLVLHRSAVALLPAAGLATALALRREPRALRQPGVALGLSLAALAAVVMLPRIVTTMRRYDPVHFTPLENPRAGFFAALGAGTRPLDLLDLLGIVSPLALAIPPTAIALGRRVATSPVAWILAAVALPWAGMTLLIHPPQGMFRDWDDYAAAGASFSMIAAWLVAAATARAPSWRWLVLPAALATLAPTLQWLALNADVERGLTRIEAYLREPPRRSDAERGRTYDFLGIRNAQLGRWDASAAAMARAAETSPSPRVLLQWALAEQARGNAPVARDVFRRVSEIAPTDARAWYGLAVESWNLGDTLECRRAAETLARVSPGSPEARQLLQGLEHRSRPDAPRSP